MAKIFRLDEEPPQGYLGGFVQDPEAALTALDERVTGLLKRLGCDVTEDVVRIPDDAHENCPILADRLVRIRRLLQFVRRAKGDVRSVIGDAMAAGVLGLGLTFCLALVRGQRSIDGSEKGATSRRLSQDQIQWVQAEFLKVQEEHSGWTFRAMYELVAERSEEATGRSIAARTVKKYTGQLR